MRNLVVLLLLAVTVAAYAGTSHHRKHNHKKHPHKLTWVVHRKNGTTYIAHRRKHT